MEDNVSLVPTSSAPPTLTSDGRTNPQWLEHVAANLPSTGSQPSRSTAFGSEQMGEWTSRPSAATQSTLAYRQGEPDRLLANGSTNPRWLEWLGSNLHNIPTKASALPQIAPAQQIRQAESIPTGQFMAALWDENYAGYEELFNRFLEEHPTHAVERLQYMGYVGYPSSQHEYEQDYLDEIPWHLQDVAKSLDEDVFYDLMTQPEHVRNFHLERELELREQRYEQQQIWDNLTRSADAAGLRALESLSSEYERAHWQELNKWRPLGGDENGNQDLRYSVMQAAYGEIRHDPHYEQMFVRAHQLLLDLPHKHLAGDEQGCAANEAVALELARRWNRELGRLLAHYISLHGRGGQTRAGNTASAVSRTGEPPRLDKYGKTNPAWLEFVARGIDARRRAA